MCEMGKKARQGFADRSKGGSLAEKSQGRKTDIFDSHTERIKVLLFGLIETPCHAACFCSLPLLRLPPSTTKSLTQGSDAVPIFKLPNATLMLNCYITGPPVT